MTDDLGLARLLRMPSSDGTLINPAFAPWQDIVTRIVTNMNDFEDQLYEQPDHQTLRNACEAHTSLYNKQVDQDNVLLLVHPTYLPQSHVHELTSTTLQDAREYMRRLTTLIDTAPRDKLGIVLLETAPHYALTSVLLEQERVDQVVLTQGNWGVPLHEDALSYLAFKNVYVAGGYSSMCLSVGFESASKRTWYPHKQLFGVIDLVLASPQAAEDSLFFHSFYVGKDVVAQDRLITSQELLEQLRA